MAGATGERAVLAPARHSPVDQTRISLEADVGPYAQPLGNSRSESLDEHLGPIHQTQDDLDSICSFQVDTDGLLASVVEIVPGGTGVPAQHLIGPIDPDHLCPEVGQNHRTEGGGAQPGQFHHPDSLQWTSHDRQPSDPAESPS
jgi:hypothetical protein